MRDLQAAGGTALTGGDLTPVDEPGQHAPAVRRKARLLAAVAAVVILADLATKILVVARLEDREPVRLLGGALLLSVSRNPGAAFSFATNATWVFTVIALVVIIVIMRTAARVHVRSWALALGLILGGAAGNLVDRLFRSPGVGRGAVVDFLDVRVWPVFNLADSAIVCGGILAVLLSLRNVELAGPQRSGRLEE